jgi:ribosomal protein L7/L12
MGWRELFGGEKAHTSEDVMREAEAARPPASPSRAAAPRSPAAAPAAQYVSPPAAQLKSKDEINRLVRAGDKIGAIKMYRQVHGVSLVNAKNAIESMASGETAGARPVPSTSASDGGRSDAEVRALLAQNQLIPAIKLYRELHDVGLSEAMTAVEAMR